MFLLIIDLTDAKKTIEMFVDSASDLNRAQLEKLFERKLHAMVMLSSIVA